MDWFSSYLKGRSQVTQIDEHVSPKEQNPCGVPQGSVLGPLLFLIYINDIHESSDKLIIFLFADDTTLLFAHKSLKALDQNIKKSNMLSFVRARRSLIRKLVSKCMKTVPMGFVL